MEGCLAEEAAAVEELARCACCRRVFDAAERAPKLLACRHHFCLACARGVLGAGRTVYCMHCWRRTDPPGGLADSLPTHAAVLALARRLAAAPPADPVPWCPRAAEPPPEARALIVRETRDLLAELARLAARRRDLLVRVLDAATTLKLRLEAELAAAPLPPAPTLSPPSLPAAVADLDRLRARHAEALAQCRLDDLVRAATVPLDFELLRRGPNGVAPSDASSGRRDPLLLLANYCTAQLAVRREATCGEAEAAGEAACGAEPGASPGGSAATPSPLSRAPAPYPLYFLALDVNGAAFGRVVVEVRDDVAPRMARNFGMLAAGGAGVAGAGYRGCSVFQCWANESVITGDFELNDGRGGRSAFDEAHFMPDDTRLAAVRGAVGMRRSQRRHDNLGLVGSQFRIVLREMRGFTAIFGFVVEGLDLVDRLSRTGDGAGKPHSTILISSCGRLD